MGCGYTEPVYQECLELEFGLQGIPALSQSELPLHYKGELLQHKFKPDFVCYELVVVEIKAVSKLTGEHEAQVHNYLHATGFKLGLLVNFAHYPKIQYQRIVN